MLEFTKESEQSANFGAEFLNPPQSATAAIRLDQSQNKGEQVIIEDVNNNTKDNEVCELNVLAQTSEESDCQLPMSGDEESEFSDYSCADSNDVVGIPYDSLICDLNRLQCENMNQSQLLHQQ